MSFTRDHTKGTELNKGFKNKYCPVCWFVGRLRVVYDSPHNGWGLCESDYDYSEERGE